MVFVRELMSELGKLGGRAKNNYNVSKGRMGIRNDANRRSEGMFRLKRPVWPKLWT